MLALDYDALAAAGEFEVNSAIRLRSAMLDDRKALSTIGFPDQSLQIGPAKLPDGLEAVRTRQQVSPPLPPYDPCQARGQDCGRGPGRNGGKNRCQGLSCNRVPCEKRREKAEGYVDEGRPQNGSPKWQLGKA